MKCKCGMEYKTEYNDTCPRCGAEPASQSELIETLGAWQSMSTAPSDGSEILVIIHGRRVVAYWSNANVWATNGATIKPICWQPLPAVPGSIPLEWL